MTDSVTRVLRGFAARSAPLLIGLGAVAGCASSDGAATRSLPGASDCNYFNYHHDEAKNALAGKCASDCDCDGMRSCKGGVCDGEARPKMACNHVDYHWNEAWNPQGAGKCASDCECDGLRSCTSGSCSGEARPSTAAAPERRGRP